MGRTGGLLDDPSGKGKARPRIWRRRLTRIVSLGMVVYAANALLGLAGWGAVVHIITPDGVTSRQLKSRQD